MTEVFNRGQNMCHLEFDPSVIGVKPIGAEESIVHNLLLLHEASLKDLVEMTGLTEKQVLSEIKILRKEFGVRGDKRNGYKLSSNPLERVAMSHRDNELSEGRAIRK